MALLPDCFSLRLWFTSEKCHLRMRNTRFQYSDNSNSQIKVKVFEKTLNFRLKLGLSLSSLVFRLSILSLNVDGEICSLHQRTTCLCDFTVKVNDNQIDATFIALGIYLKLSNKLTKESALRDCSRQWIIGKNIFEKITWHYPI